MKQQSVITNINEFDGVLREIALIDAKVTGADVDRQNDIITAEGKFAARTKTLIDRRQLLAEQLELYYRANRKDLEKGKKSVELRFGRAGIKVSAPSLKTLKGWTWDLVLRALDVTYIRTTDEVDKQKLKAAKLSDSEYAAMGVKVHQTETFFFETFPAKAEDAQ